MKGKLIVIESGTDSSGKATQANKLNTALLDMGYKVRKISFPNYKSESSALVKMYLDGRFGDKPGDVNPYVASTFYTVDRYASYKTGWKDFYENGGIVIADRYTTSNMVHQASKIADVTEKNNYLDWLWDFEFKKFELPVPDCVVFLDVPPSYSVELMRDRKNKYTGGQEKDIHEKDIKYLESTYKNACWVAEKLGWNRVFCTREGKLRTINEIHNEILLVVKKVIGN